MKELRPEQLFHRYDPGGLGFETTETAECLTEAVGQPRAVEAVRFGTGIARPGYNVFAFGVEGTGRHTLVRHQLEQSADGRPTPPDLCYVQNFADAHKPRLLDLPAGTGVALRRDMESLVEELRTAIESAFESEEYHARRDALEAEFKERPEKELRDIARRAAAEGLALLRTPGGLAMAPTRPDGEVMSKEEVEQLSEEAQQRLQSNVEMFQEEVQRTLRQMPKWTREHNLSLRELNREFTELAVGHLMDEMREKYGPMPEALVYLDEVRQDIIEHARELMQPEPSVAAVRWASLPFARRIGSFSAAARPLRSGELERQLRLQAERAERALMRAAEELRIHASFRVAQGSVAGELLAAMGEADLLSLGAGPLSTAQGSRLGSTARAVLTRAAGQVLVVPREAPPRGPVAVAADDSGAGKQALQTAADLAGARAERRDSDESSPSGLDLLVTCTGAEDAALEDFAQQTAEQLRARGLAATVRRAVRLDLVELAAAARARSAAMLIVGVENADRSEALIEAVVGAFGGPVLVVGRAKPASRG